MAGEDSSISVIIKAATDDFDKKTAKSMRSFYKELDTLQKKIDGLGPANSNAANKAVTGFNKTSQAAGQLSFQLNDIATSLAGGASPFQVMMQQGSQVTQVFSQMGGGIKGAAGAVVGALGSMLTPMNLLTFAFIFGAGKALEYFTGVDEGAKEAAKQLRTVADELDKIAKKNPESKSLKKMAADANAVAKANENVISKQADLNAVFAQADATIDDTAASLAALKTDLDRAGETDTANKVAAASLELQTAIKERKDLTEALQHVEEALKEAEAKHFPITMAYAESYHAVAEAFKLASEAGKDVKEIYDQTGTAILNFLKNVSGPLAGFVSSMQILSKLDMTNLSLGDISTTLMTLPFNETYNQAVTANPTAAKKYLAEERAANSKVAQRIALLDDEMAQYLAEVMVRLPKSAKIISAARTKAEQQAIRDSGVRPAAPAGTSHHEQRGDRQPSAVDIGGVSAQTLQNAVDQVKQLETGRGFDDPMHVQLRGQGGSTAAAVKEAKTGYDELVVSMRTKIAEQERENAINGNSKLSSEEKTAALQVETAAQERAKIELQLNNAALEQNGVLNEKTKQQNHELAESYAALGLKAAQMKTEQTVAAKRLAEETAQAQAFANQIGQMGQSAISGLITDLRNGVEAGEAFNNMLNRILDSLINMALQSLFSSSGLGGVISSFFPTKQSGGMVGSEGGTRKISPLAFAGAPRFGAGGMVGLRPGEVPIIAHRGEMVIPKHLVGRRNAGYVDNSRTSLGDVNIDMGDAGVVAASSADAKMWGERVQKIIHLEMVRESRPGGLLRKVPR